MSREIPVEEIVRKFLETEIAPDAPKQHRAKTADCLPIGQLQKHLERKLILADTQLAHIAQCAGFCQKNLAYLRRHGDCGLPQLAPATLGNFRDLVKVSLTRLGHLPEALRRFGEAVVVQGLVPVFTEGVMAKAEARHHYPLLIEDVQVSGFSGDAIITQGPWIKDGRLITRLTFTLPQELYQRRPIQLLFVGKDGVIFNALDLPGFEEQLVNVQLPVSLPDHKLEPTDPLPCLLVLRLGQV